MRLTVRAIKYGQVIITRNKRFMTSTLFGILSVSYNETVVPVVNVEHFILCKGVNYFALQVGNL